MGVPSTKTAVQAALAAHGLHPRRFRGQNFLVDPNLVQAIARSGGAGDADCVLEVGTGTGVLTWELAKTAGCVLTCDLDPRLQGLAQAAADWPGHVIFEPQDVLAGKHQLNPALMDRWERERVARGLGHRLVVANLPYSVATPFLANLLWDGVSCRDIVVLVQKEAAERFTAAVGTAEYGPVSVAVALLAEAKILRSVGPQVFWPRPKVESAVLQCTPRDPARALRLKAAGLPELLHDAFLHRRKVLRKKIDPAQLEAAGIPPEARPQEVTPEQWVRLVEGG